MFDDDVTRNCNGAAAGFFGVEHTVSGVEKLLLKSGIGQD